MAHVFSAITFDEIVLSILFVGIVREVFMFFTSGRKRMLPQNMIGKK